MRPEPLGRGCSRAAGEGTGQQGHLSGQRRPASPRPLRGEVAPGPARRRRPGPAARPREAKVVRRRPFSRKAPLALAALRQRPVSPPARPGGRAAAGQCPGGARGGRRGAGSAPSGVAETKARAEISPAAEGAGAGRSPLCGARRRRRAAAVIGGAGGAGGAALSARASPRPARADAAPSPAPSPAAGAPSRLPPGGYMESVRWVPRRVLAAPPLPGRAAGFPGLAAEAGAPRAPKLSLPTSSSSSSSRFPNLDRSYALPSGGRGRGGWEAAAEACGPGGRFALIARSLAFIYYFFLMFMGGV